MSGYHDEIWRALPEQRSLPHWEARRALCASLVSAGEVVLDLGCGDGPMLVEIERAGARAVGADVSQVALDRAARRGPFELHLVGSDGSLPFEGARFDGVWASEVLGQALDSARVLAEAARVLRPGGWLGVTTPRHGRPRQLATALRGFERAHHPQRTELRRYTVRGLRNQLHEYGFEQVRLRTTGGFPGFRTLILASARRSRDGGPGTRD